VKPTSDIRLVSRIGSLFQGINIVSCYNAKHRINLPFNLKFVWGLARDMQGINAHCWGDVYPSVRPSACFIKGTSQWILMRFFLLQGPW
jgi:hypothetical protein